MVDLRGESSRFCTSKNDRVDGSYANDLFLHVGWNLTLRNVVVFWTAVCLAVCCRSDVSQDKAIARRSSQSHSLTISRAAKWVKHNIPSDVCSRGDRSASQTGVKSVAIHCTCIQIYLYLMGLASTFKTSELFFNPQHRWARTMKR